ncbi:MAG: D-aminoacyl-tRNA deacylase [Planctomycetota bacterium]
MRAVIQRVSRASVTVDGETVGAIETGFLILLGVFGNDDEAESARLAAKIAKLRIFRSDKKPIDAAVTDVDGSALVVSQFTLCADTRKGNRPSFVRAAEPKRAEELYETFCDDLRGHGVPVQTGRFGAMMDVELVNDGPVTILL